MQTGQEIWDNLKEMCYQGDLFRISELMGEIYSIKQGNLSVGAYFTQIKGLCEQLNTFKPIPSCLCEVKCKCTLIPIIKKYRENDYVICFLMGLNDQYSIVKTRIMLMDPLPSINKVFSLLVQQERQSTMLTDDSKLIANISNDNFDNKFRTRGRGFRGQTGGRQRSQSRPQSNPRGGRCTKICTYCHKQGHTIDVCYRKHSFPPNYFTNMNNINSYMVQEPTEDEQFTNKPTDSSTKEHNEGALLGLTQEQHKSLVSLLEQSNTQHHNANQIVTASILHNTKTSGNTNTCSTIWQSDPWILDMGATDHVCYSLSRFQSFKQITPISIKLPNGENLNAHYSGTVVISSQLYLNNVLCLPSFNFNLISVSKLIKSLPYRLIFSHTHCDIQELQSLKIIGVANMKNGLYAMIQQQFKMPTAHSVNSFTSYNDNNLWYCRLGHLSHNKMLVMQSVFPFIQCKKTMDPCETCHLAKQRRLHFPDSISRTAKPFDLVHMDI
ncbi:PREDICTED: uncharacterized protein LOC109347040 [Lupinus angustifolius]|uniref:uncharacterized protein LOC109347040 n=1 Tax=Lupinus angustifolius TaxID=3871 RepID=UPI00092E33AC|nr:PREDICTED: uncharacterized protein LOC109347040 [Lupinus angustifolius]